MRYFSILLLALVLVAGCKGGSQQKDLVGNPAEVDSAQFTTISWKEKTLDFGKIAEGQKLEVVYHFTNTGTKPLIISKVEPGCGCTVAETPTEPIAPGKEGTIKGAFDSNSRVGSQHKSIFVYANTKDTQVHELVFTVEVNKKS